MVRKNKDKKKKKAITDPNAPKKPTCAYFFFQIIRRPQVKEERPYLTNTEVVIQLGKDWNILTNLQKLPFEKLAEADKIRYEKDLEVYRKDHPEVDEVEDDVEVEVETQGTIRKKKSQKRKKPKNNKDKTEKKKKKAKLSTPVEEIENKQNDLKDNEIKEPKEKKIKKIKPINENKEKVVKEKIPKEKKQKEAKTAKTIDAFLNINKSANDLTDNMQNSSDHKKKDNLNEEIIEVLDLKNN